MISIILGILRNSRYALTTREICCAINGKTKEYCMNVDGSGGRCIWWYRRPKHESHQIKLVYPSCRVRPIYLYQYLDTMVRHGIIKKWIGYLPDKLSRWRYDRHVLYYVDDEQLYRRLSKEIGAPLDKYLYTSKL